MQTQHHIEDNICPVSSLGVVRKQGALLYNIHHTPILAKLQRASAVSFFEIKKKVKKDFSSVGHGEWGVRCEKKSMRVRFR